MFGERLFLLLLFFFVLCPNRARVRCVCVCCCIVCIVHTQTYVMLCLSYLTRILSRSLYPPASMPFTLCISSVALHASIEVNSSRLCEDETATTTTKKSNNKTKTIKTILCRQIGTFWISFFLLCFSCRRIHACTQTLRCAESETANANARPLWPCACVGVLCVAFGTSSINMHARIHERARTHTHTRTEQSFKSTSLWW